MNIKKVTMAAFAAAASATLPAAVPEVSGVVMAQDTMRHVTITYTLADAPAVVTLDVQTNANTSAAADDLGWTSIGGEAVWNATGDVWKKVETGSHTITWRPDHSWPDHKIADGGARAVVTAWALDNTPDYMVVDLAAANTVRYYPAADFLPGSEIGQKGAITNNTAYKTSKLVMRKIMARGVEWTMGSADGETQRTAAAEAAHPVTLANNYYIGVFEVTQAQWNNIATNSSTTVYFSVVAVSLKKEMVCYNEIRLKANSNAAATSDEIANYSWPKAPHPSSFLGLLRSKTGLDFDLPSEAQWEFAARAGHGSGYWGDGSAILNTDEDTNLKWLGRYSNNNPGGTSYDITLPSSAGGTAIIGSYIPNDWGLYDMYGNLWEWCLDWFENNISANNGTVNIDPSVPANTLSGASGATHVLRGGSWNTPASMCRSAFRAGNPPVNRTGNNGFRVVCTAGLQ